MIEKATNTASQYEKAVDDVKHMVHGQQINLIFQNEVEFLDLKEHRFEIKSRLNP